MKFTSRFITAATLAAGLVAFVATPSAQAGNVSWSVGVGLPGVQLGVPVGLINPQRVYTPQVVYTQPAQIYGRPAPVYLQPQPVYVQPQAAYYPPTMYPQAYSQHHAQPSHQHYGSPYPAVLRQPVVYVPVPVYRNWGGDGGRHREHGSGHHHGFGHHGGHR
jgi:hypothetical protein